MRPTPTMGPRAPLPRSCDQTARAGSMPRLGSTSLLAAASTSGVRPTSSPHGQHMHDPPEVEDVTGGFILSLHGSEATRMPVGRHANVNATSDAREGRRHDARRRLFVGALRGAGRRRRWCPEHPDEGRTVLHVGVAHATASHEACAGSRHGCSSPGADRPIDRPSSPSTAPRLRRRDTRGTAGTRRRPRPASLRRRR